MSLSPLFLLGLGNGEEARLGSRLGPSVQKTPRFTSLIQVEVRYTLTYSRSVTRSLRRHVIDGKYLLRLLGIQGADSARRGVWWHVALFAPERGLSEA